MAGILIFSLMILVSLALAAAISCALGLTASWVLAHFGVMVAWYVCAVGIFVIGAILRSGKS